MIGLLICLVSLALATAACSQVSGGSFAVATEAVAAAATAAPTSTATSTNSALPKATVQPTLSPTPESTATPNPTPTPALLGSAARPIQLLFPPISAGTVIVNRAAPLAEALREATGYRFAVGIVDSEETLIELLCAAPAETIGFLSAAAYTFARDECGVTPALVAVREDGLAWQMGMLLVRPGTATELADLEGRSWSAADIHSLPNYLSFQALMTEQGIAPSHVIEMPEESSALLALRDQQADFATASFIPPIMPRNSEWVPGESEPEAWRALGVAPSRSPIGYVIVAGEPIYGGYRLRDARSRLFDTTPDIFNTTRILAVSDPIPNETIVFGAELPFVLAKKTAETLIEFAASDACGASLCSADLFGWAALEPVGDAAYDPVRRIIDTLGLQAADLLMEMN